MAVAYPAVGGFYEYSRLALGELAGFLTGWMYWYFWVIVVALEAVAGASFSVTGGRGVAPWQFTLGLMALFTVVNLLSVRSYGEAEFWFASIKVAGDRAVPDRRRAFVSGRLAGRGGRRCAPDRPWRLHAQRHRAGVDRRGSGDRILLRRRDRNARGGRIRRARARGGAGHAVGDLARARSSTSARYSWSSRSCRGTTRHASRGPT